MFIKPLDLTLIPNIAEWGDKAGNPFFSLQNKKATSSLRSFFSVGSSSAPTITYGPQKKKITEFEVRRNKYYLRRSCMNGRAQLYTLDVGVGIIPVAT